MTPFMEVKVPTLRSRTHAHLARGRGKQPPRAQTLACLLKTHP